jgi:DNA-binding transcriptional MocR family regulator
MEIPAIITMFSPAFPKPAPSVASHANLVFAKQILLVDRQGDQVTEMAVAETIETGELARHARRALNVYRGRRDAFASLLRAHFGELIRFDAPLGGLAFWIVFPNYKNLERLETRAKMKGFVSSQAIRFVSLKLLHTG